MAIPIPKVRGEISSNDLHKVLKKALSRLCHKPKIYLVDRKYQLIEVGEMVRFLKHDKTETRKYVADFHDCDDFSWTLLGNVNAGDWAGIAFGFAFSKGHAFNIFVSNNKEVFIIEPQTDNIWRVNEIPKKYKKFFLPVIIMMM